MKKVILILIVFCVLISLSSTIEKDTHLSRKSDTRMENGKTKIYTIFMDRGDYLGGGKALLESESFTTNEELLHKLRSKCSEIEFISRDITNSNISVEKVYTELESSKETIDGVIIIGDIRGEYRLAFTGLPTITVYNLFASLHTPYKLYATGEEKESIWVGNTDYKNGKILTAELDRGYITSSAEDMFEDFVYKIKLIQAIKKLKESRILQLSPYRYFSIDNYHGHDSQKHWPKDHNERFIRVLKETMGTEIIRVKPEEFYTAYSKTDKKEAEDIAEKWIKEAQGVLAAKSEIIKTARSYLAFDALREKYECNAISTVIRSVTGSGKIKDKMWPGLGLECGFKTRGIQATCQDHMNMMVTELVGYFMTGKPSMLGDLTIDRYNSVAILFHCGAPINPYGDERRAPYIIKSHAQSPVRDTKKPGSSSGLQVYWPTGEPVTFWAVDVLHKQILVFIGKTVDGHALYKNLDDIACRTKVIAKVNNIKAIQDHQSPDEYGIHRVATLGDLRQEIKDIATLLGFDVIETDRELKK
jgi:hypothetical protein